MVHQTPIKKKEPGFRVVDGLWYIDICVDSFLSANRQSPIPLKQGESTSFKKRGWKKKTTQLMGTLLGLHRSMLLLTDYMVILCNIVVCLLAFKVDPIRMLF